MKNVAVRVRSFPAGVGVGRKPRVDKSNCRNIVLTLEITVELAKLMHKEHTLINNRTARKRGDIDVIRTLLKNTPCDIKLSFKVEIGFAVIGLFDENLLDIRHTAFRFFTEHLGAYGHSTPEKKL